MRALRQNPLAGYEACRAAVAEARAGLDAGHFVDLGGLDAAVGAVCEAAQDLAPNARKAVMHLLAQLRDEVEALGTALTAFHAAELAAVDALARRRAAAAYGSDPVDRAALER